MHLCLRLLAFALTAPVLLSCERRAPTIALDPKVGRDCFQAHLAVLPPGTQYEGIERATADRLTIRVMTGAELTTVACGLNPDGTLRSSGG